MYCPIIVGQIVSEFHASFRFEIKYTPPPVTHRLIHLPDKKWISCGVPKITVSLNVNVLVGLNQGHRKSK